MENLCWGGAVRFLISASLTGCLLAEAAWGQAQPARIQWRNSADSAKVANSDPAVALANRAERHILVQFDSMPDPDRRAALESEGITLLRYLGSNAFFARVQPNAANSTGTPKGVAQAVDILLDWKLHPSLVKGEIPAYARIQAAGPQAPDKQVTTAQAPAEYWALYVIFHPDVDLQTTGHAVIAAHGGKVRDDMHSINGAVIWLPSAQLNAFAQRDEVQWVEPPLPPLAANNNSNRVITQADLVQAAPYGLSGAGVTVLVYDAGTAYAGHSDFGGRVHVRDSSGTDDHATHVSGTIGGSGLQSGGVYRGMAPAVTIESYGFQDDGTGQFLYTNPGDIESDYNQAINVYGAVVSNDSIGTNTAPNGYPCEWEGDYGATDMLIDAIVRGSLGAPMRIVWANGNERGSGRCGTTYHTTAPPACAKNHITVGALNSNDDSMTGFSSWGPSDDGRIKPDVSAPGCQSNDDGAVTSTLANGGYGGMCGTSMASPTVTGLSALILQDYKAQFPDRPLPRNSTLKILLAHNAVDLGNPGPDYKFGYGSVRVKNTIDFMRTGSFVEESIGHGEIRSYVTSVLPGTASLKATLAWDDPPGSPNVIPELVNDLDIMVISPDGNTTYLPWTLDPANGDAPAVRTLPDHVNNIEQVVVDAPAAGVWTIVVSGYAVAQGPQVFSLATTPDLRLCTSAARIAVAPTLVTCESNVKVTVSDCDLDLDPQAVETTTATVTSTSDPSGETVVLTETGPHAAQFTGTVRVSAVNSARVVQVQHGDLVTATHVDADDGQGHASVPVSYAVSVDCQPPIISGVALTKVAAVGATVTFTTNEPARATVRFGTSCGSLTGSVSEATLSTTHTLAMTGLTPVTTYYFDVQATDVPGNQAGDNNGGACYSFTTIQRKRYFTEKFDFLSNMCDMDGHVLEYLPDSSFDGYSVCISEATALPVDPSGSTAVSLSDDSSVRITLSGGKKVTLYGTRYGSLYIGSNGYLTFTGADITYVESYASHFSIPRVSALFDDLNPAGSGAQGSVMWKQEADAVVVTWQDVPEFGQAGGNTFQAVMYFDGRIVLGWAGIGVTDGLVGISAGGGQPEDFVGDDLSASTICAGLPAKAYNPSPAAGATGIGYTQTLSWTKGYRTVSHNVYWGLSPDSLVFQGNQTGTTWSPALEYLTHYYWRVDEVNELGVTTGDLWELTTKPLKPDYDADGDVDMEDYACLQRCLSGSTVPVEAGCTTYRLDGDSDVDSDDIYGFLGCLSGAGVRPATNCMP